MSEPFSIQSVGGKVLIQATDGSPETINFGWIEPSRRSIEMRAADADALATMPPFGIRGAWDDDKEQIGLWEFAKAANNGAHFLTFWQQTGSCFPADTSVLLESGRSKRIDDIRVGDQVVTHEGHARRVSQTFTRPYTGAMLRVGTRGGPRPKHVTCTEDHQFGVRSQTGEASWVAAKDLSAPAPGINHQRGQATLPLEVLGASQASNLRVYDFEVEEDHSFVAQGMVVHNCVGNGVGQGTWHLSAVEVMRLHDAEQVLLPFYLLPYGRSRFHGGMRGRGEGSFGSAAAVAMRDDGVPPFNLPGLPQPTFDQEKGLTWGREQELIWSDGGAISDEWLQKSRRHLVKSVVQVNSGDDAWAAMSNYYPMTCASSWGGQMRPQVQGTPGCLLNRRSTTWQHQMCVIGRWRHPTLGKLFYILNSWGPKVHGTCPSGAQPGGFWITIEEMDWICKTGEVFALSQYEGMPAQKFSWAV